MIFDYGELSLATEGQPSIRFIIEWLMVKIIKTSKLDLLIGNEEEHDVRDDYDENNYLWAKMNSVN